MHLIIVKFPILEEKREGEKKKDIPTLNLYDILTRKLVLGPWHTKKLPHCQIGKDSGSRVRCLRPAGQDHDINKEVPGRCVTGCVKGWVKREEHIMKSVSAQETEQMGQVCR